MKLFWHRATLCGLLVCTPFALWAAGSEAARVAIIKYDDKTGTKNFEYMPGSLQDAITKSMHKKFEFVDVDPAKIEPIVAEIRAKNKGLITATEAAEICRKADIDILIYGSFTFNKIENEIEINTDISLGSTDKFRTLPLVENRVDATIFQAADKVAVNIVAEITKVALEQQQSKAKDPKDKKGKTQLEKTEKSKTWADLNWMITAAAGPVLPLISQDYATPKVDGMLNLHIARRFKDGWHFGLLGSWGSIRTQGNSSSVKSQMEVGAAALTAGYFWDLSPRWRATSLIGTGYYYGSFNRYVDCASACGASGGQSEKFIIKNPFALARAGIHFMIFSFLALGLEADYRMYFDSPKPVQAVGATLAITGMF
jgi:hypothetical protein